MKQEKLSHLIELLLIFLVLFILCALPRCSFNFFLLFISVFYGMFLPEVFDFQENINSFLPRQIVKEINIH